VIRALPEPPHAFNFTVTELLPFTTRLQRRSGFGVSRRRTLDLSSPDARPESFGFLKPEVVCIMHASDTCLCTA